MHVKTVAGNMYVWRMRTRLLDVVHSSTHITSSSPSLIAHFVPCYSAVPVHNGHIFTVVVPNVTRQNYAAEIWQRYHIVLIGGALAWLLGEYMEDVDVVYSNEELAELNSNRKALELFPSVCNTC